MHTHFKRQEYLDEVTLTVNKIAAKPNNQQNVIQYRTPKFNELTIGDTNQLPNLHYSEIQLENMKTKQSTSY